MSLRSAFLLAAILAAALTVGLGAQFADEGPERAAGSPFLARLDVPRTVRDSLGTVVTLAAKSGRAAKDFVTLQTHRVSFDLVKGQRPMVFRRFRQRLIEQIEAAGGRVGTTDTTADSFALDYWFADQALFGMAHAWLVDTDDGRMTVILLVHEAAYEPQWLKDRQASRRP
jgi:hypothetical protein